MSITDLTTTRTVAAKRTPSGIFARSARASADAGLVELTTSTATAMRTRFRDVRAAVDPLPRIHGLAH
jgi:hypothetical protein